MDPAGSSPWAVIGTPACTARRLCSNRRPRSPQPITENAFGEHFRYTVYGSGDGCDQQLDREGRILALAHCWLPSGEHTSCPKPQKPLVSCVRPHEAAACCGLDLKPAPGKERAKFFSAPQRRGAPPVVPYFLGLGNQILSAGRIFPGLWEIVASPQSFSNAAGGHYNCYGVA
jgi:hypothetical protein